MTIIDSHQHFWHYTVPDFAWLNEDMHQLRCDFLPEHLQPILHQNHVAGCIAVQARQSLQETHWLLELAHSHTFIKGVVGWVNLCSADIDAQLLQLSRQKKLVGFRHILQAETPEYMLQPAFINGISHLAKYHFTYDILVYPRHLKAAIELVQRFPQQQFVLDHLAKPHIQSGEIAEWEKDILQLAKHSNVSCKISGMVTEADWQQWKTSDLLPYLDVIKNCFGPRRILFGSDWPMCLLATSYRDWLQLLLNYFASSPEAELKDFFALNAQSIYGIE